VNYYIYIYIYYFLFIYLFFLENVAYIFFMVKYRLKKKVFKNFEKIPLSKYHVRLCLEYHYCILQYILAIRATVTVFTKTFHIFYSVQESRQIRT